MLRSMISRTAANARFSTATTMLQPTKGYYEMLNVFNYPLDRASASFDYNLNMVQKIAADKIAWFNDAPMTAEGLAALEMGLDGYAQILEHCPVDSDIVKTTRTKLLKLLASLEKTEYNGTTLQSSQTKIKKFVTQLLKNETSAIKVSTPEDAFEIAI